MNAITHEIENAMSIHYKGYTFETIGHYSNLRPHFQKRYAFTGTVIPDKGFIFDDTFVCGDTIVWFKSPLETWGAGSGSEGYALVRDGNLIESVLTMYS